MRTTPRTIAIPREFMRASAAKPPPSTADTGIYLSALCAREFGATFCQLLLASRLGGDVFYAGSLVTLYINVVFRRPMVNPFVLALAVWSAGDWKRANVMGYPGMIEAGPLARAAVGSLVLVADLGGALAAARLRADYGRTFGDEFVRNAAGGAGQLSLRVRDVGASCWSGDRFPGGSAEIPLRLYSNDTAGMLRDDGCVAQLQWGWWVLEDLGAVFFLIVGYVHVWRCLRWKDMHEGAPTDRDERYWTNLLVFSLASASLGLVTAIAFPTAHAGLHTSLYLAAYQEWRGPVVSATANALGEPLYRALGGAVGCVLALMYEWALVRMDPCGDGTMCRADGTVSWGANLMHKMLYFSPVPARGR